MYFLNVNPYEEIISNLISAHNQKEDTKNIIQKINSIIPADYCSLLKKLGACKIASDFIFLGPSSLEIENTYRDCPKCQLGEKWWLFATSSSGDGWLLRSINRTFSEVAFLDHNKETEAIPEDLGVNFKQWFQLANLITQVEKIVEENPGLINMNYRLIHPLAKKVRERMEQISEGLSQRYPYLL